jgi:glycosyltransferase involved in cell wall biosynthesis
MRIGVDGRDLAHDEGSGLRQARGVGRYAASLLAALAERHPGDEWQVLLPPGAEAPPIAGVSFHHQRGPRRVTRAAAVVAGRPRLDRLLGEGLDVFWLPSPAPAALSRLMPYVLTVHDLATELRPADFRPYARLWNRAARPRRLALGARHVMVDSAATRDDVLTRWRLDPDRVSIVRPGVWRPPPGAVTPASLGLPSRYLLFVGALEPRKGLDVLLDAFAKARAGGLRAELVIAGDGPLRDALARPGVHRTGRVDDPTLAALYAGARATVLPSRLEGFGFTPLESLAAGTPVVASDLPPLRETLGDAALFAPPGDVEALARALLAVDGDEAVRARVLRDAPAALAPLNWDRAADQAYAVLLRAAAA